MKMLPLEKFMLPSPRNFSNSILGIFIALISNFLFANPQTSIPTAPDIDAISYILIDGETGASLAESQADQRAAPASLTKMMSSYLAIDEIKNGRLKEQDKVPISIKAWKMAGSRMFVREGTKVALIDLLRGTIIQSGNDATLAIAEYMAGNESSFVDIMNSKAIALGMTATHFQNSVGLPSPEHHSSARDLARLAQAVIYDHPAHYSLYSEKEFTFNHIRQPNRNLLLSRDPTVDGLKTGHTEEAGFCLAASAKRDKTRLIAIVLGAKSDAARTKGAQTLFTYGFRYYETVELFKANIEITKTPIWRGKIAESILGLERDIRLTIPRENLAALQAIVHLNNAIKAPITAGQKLGTLSIELNGKTLTSLPLVALHDIEQSGFFARLWDDTKLFFRELFSSPG